MPQPSAQAGRAYLHPSLFAQAAILLCAIVLGTLAYTWCVRDAYNGLYQAYHEDEGGAGNVVTQTLAEDPFIERSWVQGGAAATEEGQRRVLLRTLQLLGLVGVDETLEDLDQPGFDRLHAIFFQQGGAPDFLLNGRSVELVVHLAQSMPGAQAAPHGMAPSDVREQTGQTLAAVLADQPGALSEYRNLLEATTPKELSADSFAYLNRPVAFFRAFRLSGGQPLPETEALNLLFTQTRVTDCYDPLRGARKDTASAQRCPLTVEEYRFLAAFAGQLVNRLHAAPAIKNARKGIALWQGVVQLGLLVCFFWLCGLLGARHFLRRRYAREADRLNAALRLKTITPEQVQRFDVAEKLFKEVNPKKDGLVHRLLSTCYQHLQTSGSSANEESLENVCLHIRAREAGSRWILQWLAGALPALGFIGTVYGIADALKNADSMVRAQTVDAQAAAITGVAGSLGVAFTTTLLALVMGLITSLISDHQAFRERLLVNGLEETLMPLIDPATTYDPQDEEKDVETQTAAGGQG